MANQVKIFEWKKVEGASHFEKVEKGIGDFCRWGCSYEVFETGPGNYSTAIIQMPDGTRYQYHALKGIEVHSKPANHTPRIWRLELARL